jgi:N-acylneuraminate cytidylyltransferase/CMP-N,N'-diacetyllegionaminic acid synthase
MKPICIIPARAGSKSVPNKNIRLIAGKPLIYYTIKSALESKLFSHVIVSTEDKKTASIAKKYGAEVPFMRPRNLATDKTPQEQVLLHAVKKLNSLGIDFEIFVYRDCTVPFIDSSDMNGAIELLKKSDCYSTCASIKAHPNPYFGMWEPNKEGFLKISKTTDKVISRRQDAPIVYIIDGLFVFWTKKFLKTRKCLTSKMLPYEISREHSHMIDFPFDFKVAESLINSKSSH